MSRGPWSAHRVGCALMLLGLPASSGCHDRAPQASPLAAVRQPAPSKILQLLGDEDRATVPPLLIGSQTLTRHGIAGADLGYPVVLGGRTLFLFADVVGTSDAVTQAYADVVGWSDDVTSTSLDLDFFPPAAGSVFPFLPLTLAGEVLGQNDGPSSAFVDGSDLFVFFDVGFREAAVDPVTGAAAGKETGILGVSHDEGQSFSPLIDLPSPLVWTQTAVVSTSEIAGLTWTTPRTLLVWGRDGAAPVLAAAPLEAEDDPAWVSRWVWRSAGAWSTRASTADSIHEHDGCYGNFSVSRVAGLDTWLLLERCPSAASRAISAIRYRVASSPLGPWSSSAVWFDATEDAGFCHFVHRACVDGGASCCDDDVTGFGFDETVGGRPYAPYVLPALGEWDPASATATVYGIMSTFNPYTPVLMRTQLRAAPAE